MHAGSDPPPLPRPPRRTGSLAGDAERASPSNEPGGLLRPEPDGTPRHAARASAKGQGRGDCLAVPGLPLPSCTSARAAHRRRALIGRRYPATSTGVSAGRQGGPGWARVAIASQGWQLASLAPPRVAAWLRHGRCSAQPWRSTGDLDEGASAQRRSVAARWQRG